MKRYLRYVSPFIAVVIMLLLILDTKVAYIGAKEGIRMCIEVIIPSLFPFIVVSNYLCTSLIGACIPGIGRIGRFFQLPKGCESLLLLGFLGGYPVGAQLIGDAYKRGSLDKRTACILLGYCNNAGPSFIFGVISSAFSSPNISFVIWAIHIFSALVTGYLLPRPEISIASIENKSVGSTVQALQKSVRAMASICGWVIIFKIVISYMSLYFDGKVSQLCLITLSGILELSNGCMQLSNVSSESVRFLICSVYLSFGSICVLLQTASVTEGLGLGLYIPGKIIQTGISMIFSLIVSPFLFAHSVHKSAFSFLIYFICFTVIWFCRKYCKTRCENV